MFANTQMAGQDVGTAPDVCLTPSPAGPVPIPYPNIAMGPTAVPSQTKVLILGAPMHNLQTSIPMTNGDNAGVNMGVASGTVMGPSRHTTGAMSVIVAGAPASRLTSTSLQNSTNCPGARVVPSQTKVVLVAK
jgi:hypothetical protein